MFVVFFNVCGGDGAQNWDTTCLLYGVYACVELLCDCMYCCLSVSVKNALCVVSAVIFYQSGQVIYACKYIYMGRGMKISIFERLHDRFSDLIYCTSADDNGSRESGDPIFETTSSAVSSQDVNDFVTSLVIGPNFWIGIKWHTFLKIPYPNGKVHSLYDTMGKPIF